MQPALLRKPGVAGAHGADAVETVGENPHPDAGTADQHGDVGFAAGDRPDRRDAEIRVVVAVVIREGAAVEDRAAFFFEKRGEFRFL